MVSLDSLIYEDNRLNKDKFKPSEMTPVHELEDIYSMMYENCTIGINYMMTVKKNTVNTEGLKEIGSKIWAGIKFVCRKIKEVFIWIYDKFKNLQLKFAKKHAGERVPVFINIDEYTKLTQKNGNLCFNELVNKFVGRIPDVGEVWNSDDWWKTLKKYIAEAYTNIEKLDKELKIRYKKIITSKIYYVGRQWSNTLLSEISAFFFDASKTYDFLDKAIEKQEKLWSENIVREEYVQKYSSTYAEFIKCMQDMMKTQRKMSVVCSTVITELHRAINGESYSSFKFKSFSSDLDPEFVVYINNKYEQHVKFYAARTEYIIGLKQQNKPVSDSMMEEWDKEHFSEFVKD